MTQSARDIDDEAADWAVRLAEHGEDPRVFAASRSWLAADPRRTGALLRAEAGLHLIDRGRALAGPNGPIRYERLPLINRRQLLWAGGAGGAIAAGVGAVLFTQMSRRRFDTGLGEIRRVPLSDGSLAAINTSSRVSVLMRPKQRIVQLRAGEAWFQVAKDASRPFVVEAGDVRVRAVGTAFSVRRRDDGADVLVTEGVVETWSVSDVANLVRIAAGSKAFVSDTSGGQSIAQTGAGGDIDRELAWREGKIVLHDQTLAEAAAEFNRYNVRKIVVANSALAGQGVVGQFRTDQPESFAKAAASALGAAYETTPDEIRITPSS